MRLQPLPADQWDEATQQALSAMREPDAKQRAFHAGCAIPRWPRRFSDSTSTC